MQRQTCTDHGITIITFQQYEQQYTTKNSAQIMDILQGEYTATSPQIKKIFRYIQKMTRKSPKKKREWFLVHRQIIQKEIRLRKQHQLPVNLLQLNDLDLRLGSQLK